MVQLHVIYATDSLHWSSINLEVVSDLNLLNEASQTLSDSNVLFCLSIKQGTKFFKLEGCPIYCRNHKLQP